MKIACVIMAAGKSKRFGTANKLTREIRGKALAMWIADVLPVDVFSDVVAVVSSETVEKLYAENNIRCVRYPGGEVSDSVRCGLAALDEDTDGILFVNADRPFLKRSTIRSMVRAFEAHPACAVRLFCDGMPSNPVLFPRAAKKDLLCLQGDRGGSAILKSGKYEVYPVEACDPSEVLDADTPEELENMRRWAESCIR